MAYQEFPPPISCSPPPLDSVLSADDDEENPFAQNTSFDITGLSEKLPPTPDLSPSKSSLPPLPNVPLISNIHNTDIFSSSGIGQNIPTLDTGDDFGEFVDFGGASVMQATQKDSDQSFENPENMEQFSPPTNTLPPSFDFQISNFNAIPTVESEGVIKEGVVNPRNCSSRNSDVEEDDHSMAFEDRSEKIEFLEETITLEKVDIKKQDNQRDQEEVKLNEQEEEIMKDQEECNLKDEENLKDQNEGNLKDQEEVYVKDQEKYNANDQKEGNSEDLERFNLNKQEEDNLKEITATAHLNTQNLSSNNTDDFELNCQSISGSNIPDTVDSADDSDFGDFANFNSLRSDNDLTVDPKNIQFDEKPLEVNDESDEDFGAFANFTQDDNTSSLKVVGEEGISSNVAVPADDVVMSCYLPTTSEDKLTGGTVSPETDDLEFTNNTIEPLVEDSIKNDSVEQDTESDVLKINDDFVADNINESPEEFDEFASAKIDDAFGEEESKDAFDDDDFGDFNSATQTETPGNDNATLQRGVSLEFDSTSTHSADPLLSKLETLICNWLEESPLISKANPPLVPLKDVVCDDAFVWRKLEQMEWHNVVWESCAAYERLLNSINVDARNILFNQKLSSSVPVFAQSLSFSPLTPLKPASTAQSNKLPTVRPQAAVLEKITPLQDLPALNSIANDPPKSKEQTSFDWLEKDLPMEGSLDSSKPKDSGSVVQQLIAKTSKLSHVTPLSQLNEKEQKFIKSLPNLSFMNAKVLMFPVPSDSN